VKNSKCILAFLFVLPACGAQSQLNQAKRLEDKGKYEKAWAAYQRIAAKNPKSPIAPEALFRAGLMAQRRLNDCYMAGTFYDRVIENYSQSEPWAKVAFLQKQNCPDYYPLLAGTQWIEGDSETKGKNARIQTTCKPLPESKPGMFADGGVLEKTYFAGDKKSSSFEFIYRKVNNELLEFQSPTDAVGKVLLRWPLEKGQTWKTRPGSTTFIYEIESLSEKVDVQAGTYENCLKVGFTVSGISGASTHEYYAPGVGRVLTTVSSKGSEVRVTELLSLKLGEQVFP
jgi:tetratricopeptide (TPR) repeat protein